MNLAIVMITPKEKVLFLLGQDGGEKEGETKKKSAWPFLLALVLSHSHGFRSGVYMILAVNRS